MNGHSDVRPFGNGRVGLWLVLVGLLLLAVPCRSVGADAEAVNTASISRPDFAIGESGKNLTIDQGRIAATTVPTAKAASAPFDQWQWRSPLPQPNPVSAVAYGNNTFVAAGLDDTLLTSPDGINWVAGSIEKGAQIVALIYADKLFVAVGNAVYTSRDGVTWKKRWSRSSAGFYTVAWGNNSYVAAGATACLTSRDGVKWKERAVPGPLHAVAYGNGIFVGLGYSSVFTSPDGIDWTERQTTTAGLEAVAYGNGVFVTTGIVTDTGAYYLSTSTDGAAWTRVPLEGHSLPDIGALAFCNDAFFAATAKGGIITSADGVVWTTDLSATGLHVAPMAMTYGDNTFVAVGDYSVAGVVDAQWASCVYSSSDGISWTERSYTVAGVSAVAYGRGTFVAVGPSGVVVTSGDGATWQKRDPGTSDDLTGIAYGNGTFVGVAGSGTVITSPDGTTWVTHALEGFGFSRVFYGNGVFLGLSASTDSIAVSTDGATWTVNELGTNRFSNAVAYGAGTFVLVGSRCLILTSSDGGKWAERAPEIGEITFKAIAYGNGIFVAAGDLAVSSGVYYLAVYTSSDGVKWRAGPVMRGADIYQIVYANDTFVAVGQKGSGSSPLILTSTDGAHWKQRAVPPPETTSHATGFGSVAYGRGTFVSVGTNRIIQSDNTCSYVISPERTGFGATGGKVVVGIKASETDCPAPGISASADWISYSPLVFDNGEGSVTITASANPTSSDRVGKVRVGSVPFPVTERAAPCTISSLTPASESFGGDGGTGTITVDFTPGDCRWTAQVRGASWISVTSGSHGAGSGSVAYKVKANSTKKERAGGIRVALAKGGAKQTTAVNQAGR